MNNLEDLRHGHPSLFLRQSIQSLDHCLDFLLSKKLLNKLFCVSLSRLSNCINNDGLTKFSFLGLFGCQSGRGEQLHEYLDNHFIHSDCRRDLGICLKAIHEAVNRLEQVGQCIIVVNDVLDRLMGLEGHGDARLETKGRHLQRVGLRGLTVLPSQAIGRG